MVAAVAASSSSRSPAPAPAKPCSRLAVAMMPSLASITQPRKLPSSRSAARRRIQGLAHTRTVADPCTGGVSAGGGAGGSVTAGASCGSP